MPFTLRNNHCLQKLPVLAVPHWDISLITDESEHSGSCELYSETAIASFSYSYERGQTIKKAGSSF